MVREWVQLVVAAPGQFLDREMPDSKRSELYIRLRLYYRLTRLGLHIAEGFALAVACGALFVQYREYQQPIIRWWHKRLCNILGVQIRVHGVPIDSSALWISNHVSWLDIPVLGSHYPLYFLSKAEVADWPLIGSLAKAAGTLFIKRGSGDSGKVSDQLKHHLDANRNVLFFPEGTTTNGHSVKRFFSKLFAGAIEADCKIQPVLVCYRDDDGLHAYAPFIDDDEFFAHAIDLMKSEPLVVDVKILPAESIDGRDSKALAKHFEDLMRRELQALHGAEEPPRRVA